MTPAKVEAFLKSQDLWQGGPVAVTPLTGGYLNEVLKVTTGPTTLVLKRFAPAATGTLFPNLPDDEARALALLGPLWVAPHLMGYWPDQALMACSYVEGGQWQSGTGDVARLLLRKEAADPSGFRKVPTGPAAILAEGDALFGRCKASPAAARPGAVAVDPLPKLSLVHTDLGASNLIGAGAGLRIIDWQCPAAGDLTEDIYSFLSPGFHILNLHPTLTPDAVAEFWAALGRPDLQVRYRVLRPCYAWRMAAYCLWRSETRPEAEIRALYARAYAAELADMERTDAG